MNSEKKIDIYSGIFLLIFSIVLFVSTLSFQQMTVARIGSAFFPQIASIGIGLLSIILIITPFIQKRLIKNSKQNIQDESANIPVETEKIAEKEEGKEGKKYYGLVLLTLLLLIMYVALMSLLGFIISTALYLFFQMFIMSKKQNRKLIVFAVISVITSALIYWIFRGFFNLTLPVGILG